MLVKDPSQRISIPGIMAHPWFQSSLPQGLMDLNGRVDPTAARQVGGCEGAEAWCDEGRGGRRMVLRPWLPRQRMGVSGRLGGSLCLASGRRLTGSAVALLQRGTRRVVWRIVAEARRRARPVCRTDPLCLLPSPGVPSV